MLIDKPEWSGGELEAPMRRFLLIGVVALLSTSANGHDSSTAVLCGDRNEIVEGLSEQFKEKPEAVGVVDKSVILEIFVSPDATWTIIASDTDGKSCLVSSGEGWQSLTVIAGTDS